MTEPLDPDVVVVCEEYARLLCASRAIFQSTQAVRRLQYAIVLRGAARFLTEMAPGTAGPHLDTIKKIMEIDTATTDPNVILMRASVIAADTTPTPRPGWREQQRREFSFTCRQCGMTSYNAHDISERYCGNCKTWETIVP